MLRRRRSAWRGGEVGARRRTMQSSTIASRTQSGVKRITKLVSIESLSLSSSMMPKAVTRPTMNVMLRQMSISSITGPTGSFEPSSASANDM
eukprot:6646196-Prymnesium_polylepis.2